MDNRLIPLLRELEEEWEYLQTPRAVANLVRRAYIGGRIDEAKQSLEIVKNS